jgi:hypothetical protein
MVRVAWAAVRPLTLGVPATRRRSLPDEVVPPATGRETGRMCAVSDPSPRRERLALLALRAAAATCAEDTPNHPPRGSIGARWAAAGDAVPGAPGDFAGPMPMPERHGRADGQAGHGDSAPRAFAAAPAGAWRRRSCETLLRMGKTGRVAGESAQSRPWPRPTIDPTTQLCCGARRHFCSYQRRHATRPVWATGGCPSGLLYRTCLDT